MVKVHHAYVEESIPVLKSYLAKLEKVHLQSHPELEEIHRLFAEGAAALTVHMKKEELVLFPYIQSMVKAKREGIPLPEAHFGAIENPIQMMEDDHKAEGARFARISNLTQAYEIPNDACATFRVAYQMLEEFENDLRTHIHLENNILFPMAMAMFAELKG
ncbi:hemerythrin domain-containing protein [Cyclobacterium qasimii]|uniref:hemerythrin domain-containing protein n=1 Tax=Cyclobacterium qasimii TaxID=1350429 RepID=UPI0021CD6541|nr:hemerythrin domain-containing protein [Cyclobacterium qasimii]